MIVLLISQVNFLLCTINDVLDHKLLEEKKFGPKNEIFSLQSSFKFILDLFAPQISFIKTSITFKSVARLHEPIDEGIESEEGMLLQNND